MDSNTRATRHRLLVFFLCLMVVASYSLPMNLFKGPMGAQEAYAAGGPVDIDTGGTMELLGTDDTRTTLTNMNGETAQITHRNNPLANPYQYQLNLDNLTPSAGRTLTIELAEGLQFGTYGQGDTVLGAAIDGDIVTTNFAPRRMLYVNEPYRDSDSVTPDIRNNGGDIVGKVQANLTGNATKVVWNFSIAGQPNLHYKDIKDAITVTYTDNGKTYVQKVDFLAKPGSGRDPSNVTWAAGRQERTVFPDNSQSWSNSNPIWAKTVEMTYECPPGVTLELKPTAPAEFFTLSAPDTSTPGVTKYKLTAKNIMMQWYADRFYEPLYYVVNQPNASVEELPIKAVKKVTNHKDEVLLEVNAPRTIKLAPAAAMPYVGYVNKTAAVQNNKTANPEGHVYTGSTPYDSGNERLATFAMGNAGATDSKPQTVHIVIDDSKAHVTNIPMPVKLMDDLKTAPGTVNVKVVTNKRTLTVPYTIPATANTMGDYITKTKMGLANDEWIKEVTYDIGVIPASTEYITYRGFYGKWVGTIPKVAFNEAALDDTFGTYELYETATPTVTTGTTPLRAAWVANTDYTFGGSHTDTITAGQRSKTMGLGLGPYMHDNFSDYVVYIIKPEKCSITFTGISASNFGSIQKDVKITTHKTTDGKDYYKLDFSAVDAEKRRLGTHPLENGGVLGSYYLSIYYTVKADVDAPAQIWRTEDNCFVEFTSNPPNAAATANAKGLALQGGSLHEFNHGYSGYVEVLPFTDVRAESQAKTAEMEEYITYDATKPQTVLPIGVSDTDKVTLKTTITNMSGTAAPAGTKVWQPIPKKGEDWSNIGGFNLLEGSKAADGSDTAGKAPYTLTLLKKLEGVDTALWKVEYGIDIDLSAAGSGAGWDSAVGQWKENPTDAELANVNCVRFTAITDIPALDVHSNPFSESVEFEVAVDTEGASVMDMKGATMVLSPLVYRDLSRVAGLEKGEPTAMEIAIGKVKGEVWHDRNRDGKWNDGETIVDTTGDGNYEVVLYGGPEGQKQVIKTGKVAADGTYRFSGLATGSDFDGYYSVRITNRDGQGKDFRGVNDAAELNDDEMIVSPKHSGSESGKTKHNAFTHNTAAGNASLKGYAYSEPITAVDAENYDFNLSLGGHYNVGVYYADNQSTNATVVKFVVDTAKGTLTAPTNQGSWVTVEDGDAADGTLSYSGAAVDKLVWPVSPTAKEGYEFKGWKVEGADDSTAKAAPTGDATFGYEDVTYEAVFSAKPYKATYDTDGGEPANGEFNVPCGEVIKDAEGFPANPTKEGFIFGGWVRTDVTPEATLKDDDTMPAKPITLKAKWVELDDFTVAFEENGGSIVNDLTFVKWTKDKLTEGITISKAGSKFLGWFIDQAMTKAYAGESYGTIAVRDTVKLITLYAMWEENSYEVKYLDKDGNEVAASRTMKWETAPITPSNAPEKQGHTFKGWYKEAALTNSYNNEAFKDLATSDAAGTIVNLYAKFEAISFTASFDPNGGEGTMEDLDITYGDGTKAPAVGFTKDGYVADGWNTKADGSGDSYAVGADISKLADKDGKTVKLYPKWVEVTYNVKTEDGKKVTPSADTPVNKDTAKRGNEITGTPEGGSEGDYVIKNVGPANPTTGVAEVIVVPITYPVADDQGNSVTPSDDTPVGKDTKKGDVIKDDAGKPYVVNKVADKADPDTGKKPVTVKKVTYKVNDPVGNDITPKNELTDPAKGDEFPGKNEQTGKDDDYVINKVDDPDPETGISKVTAIPVTYPVEDEQGKKITPSDETPVGKDTRKGDEIDSSDGKPYVVNKIADKANPNTGEKVITVKPINYVVEDNSGNGVTPSEPLDHPVKGDVIEDPTGNEYVVNKVDPADPDTGDKPVTVIPVTYPVVDNQGNPVTPSDDTPVGKDTKKGDVIDDGTGKPYVVNKVDDKPDPDTGEKKVTVIPVTYDVEDPAGNDVTPKDELVKPVKGDEFEDPSGNEYVVNKVDDPNPDTGISKVKAIPVTYPVVDNKGRPVYPADDENIGKDTAKGDEFDDENGKPYIVNKVDDKANPDTGEKKVTAIPVTYDVKDKGGNKVTPKDDLNKPVKGDVFPDKNDNDYVVNEVKKPNPDTGVSEVTAIPVTWPVIDDQHGDKSIIPATPLKRPAEGDIFPDKNDDDYVVFDVDPVDPETGVAQVVAHKVTWPVYDKDGEDVTPKTPLKRPVKGNTFEDENGDVWTVDSVGEVDPATGEAKVTASRVAHTYAFTVGNGQGWTKGSKNGLNFTVKRSINDGASFGRFEGLKVDGVEVASANYTKKAGSVLIDLKPSYLEGLATGGHRITAIFSDGIAEGSFTVHPKAKDVNPNPGPGPNPGPKTGDMTLYGLMIALMIVAAMTMIAVAVKRRHNA